jgi:YbbR domain-containing protein
VVGDPPATVDVRLRGSSGLLSRLEGTDVVAVIDLSTARPGSRLFHIRADEVRAPYGVEVAQVVPGTLAIELEKSASRVVPVVPPLEGDPAPGFVVGRITSDPATVEIRGPESRVRRLAEAITEPVDVAGSRERVRDIVTVGVADSALRLTRPQSATVVVDVVPAPVEREIAGVLVRWRNLGSGFRADVAPKRTRVSVRGRREHLNSLSADDIDAFVDLAGLGPGRYNLRVQTDPSQDFGVSAVAPQVVDVTIK